MKYRYVVIFSMAVAMVFCPPASRAQIRVNRLLAGADSARLSYDFKTAEELCRKALEVADSSDLGRIEEQLMMAQNGLNMMDYCSDPTVVARQTFPLKDFFLFYPLPNKSWRKSPNQLDSTASGRIPTPVFYPDGAEEIYYSCTDEQGIRNICRTIHKDSLWTVPTLINEHITSYSDEIFPMVSADGKTLTFASSGLYGMGGYDLYQAEWNPDTNDWGVPVNMGFPYSSPYNDFLLINTEDGKYTIFASDRGCGKDSVCIYVLEYDVMPVRTSVGGVKELRTLSSLVPKDDPTRIDNDSAVSGKEMESPEQQHYLEQLKAVRTMRDSLARFTARLDGMRSRLASASDDEKAALTDSILESELHLPALNDALKKAVGKLQEIEMDFLMKGMVFDAGKLQAQADKEVVGASSGYTFTRNEYGPSFALEMEQPVRKFDYSFMILPEGRFAEDNNLPAGLVYQIQIFTQSRKATVADINGLSPVFERLNPSGKYTCSVGLFRNYASALENLNKVKGRGFRTAIITAYKDGKPVGVAEARKMESEITSLFFVKIFPENGQSLAEQAVSVIQDNTDKDLQKSVENGSIIYRVGPFNDGQEAENLMQAIRQAGEGNVSVIETR
ncbi:MAG: hypothetical protein ACI399_04915 [Candidatus Cryptobacteroides sp.]